MTEQTHPDPQAADRYAQGCGSVLRVARERAGLTLQEVGGQLKMPVRVLQALEDENWEMLGAPVFVRGQLRSYARLLKVDLDPYMATVQLQPVRPADLVSRSHTPRYQRVMESVARRAVYVVITAAIAVPVWMVTRQHVDSGGQAVIALDVDPSSMGDGTGTPSPAATARTPQRPLVASMAPPVQRGAPALPATPQSLSLEFRGDSWVQVIGPDGREIEQALLRAGDSRSYEPGQVGRVVLGNAGGVEVRRNGEIQDLDGFKRANVARFEVSSDGSLTPVTE